MSYSERAQTKRLVPVQAYLIGPPRWPVATTVARWVDVIDAALNDSTLFVPPLAIMVVEINLIGLPPEVPTDLLTGKVLAEYLPDRQVIWMAAHAASQELLAHELGHHVAVRRPEGLANAFRDVFRTIPQPVPGGQDFWRAAVKMAGGK